MSSWLDVLMPHNLDFGTRKKFEEKRSKGLLFVTPNGKSLGGLHRPTLWQPRPNGLPFREPSAQYIASDESISAYTIS